MKYFGKLAGNTNAHTALTSIPSAATGTPFTAPSPGAKLFTNGENFSHDAVSRALSALAANNDYVASLLDSPVLRTSSALRLWRASRKVRRPSTSVTRPVG